MLNISFARFWALAAVLAISGCATVTREPPNLYPHKQQIRAYVDSGQYQHDIERVASNAKAWIEQRAARGGMNLAVVFDLDETLLLNWPHMSAMDFGYVKDAWARWVEDAKAPAIEPVREVYRAARRQALAVVFITGRTERDRAGTERNLRAIDCADYVRLVCAPEGERRSNADYKSEVRRRLSAEGFVIIANIGDQESDLVGGFAERTFKLPNPFYLTP